MKEVNFLRRGIELLANKFVLDYKSLGQGLEIESVYERWAKTVLRDESLREKVWSVVFRKFLRR